MRFKKFLAVILACALCLSVLAFPVSANVSRNTAGYYTFLYGILNKYKNGEISLNDLLTLAFDEYMNTGMDNIEDAFTSLADIINSIADTGVDVLYKWHEYNYGGPVHRDDSILNGYGAVCIDKLVSTGEIVSRYFGAYGVIHTEWGNALYMYPDDDTNVLYIYDKVEGKETVYTERKACGNLYSNGTHEWFIYGDWRYSDDSSADDVTEDLPLKDPPNYDDPDVPEDDLIDFLEDLLQDLMLQYPDMSTIEGLLAAILNKLGTLDSDNDNALLSDILTAIQALRNTDESTDDENKEDETTDDNNKDDEPIDNSSLINALEELKNALIFKDDDKIASVAQLLNELVQNQVRRSDITIDPSLYNQRFALIQAKLLGKFSFISSIKSLIDYALDKYSCSNGSPTISFNFNSKEYTIDFSYFDSHINVFQLLLAAFIYLSYAFKTFRKIPGYVNGGDNS